MACRDRDEVIDLLNKAEFKIFHECQRGAFNTYCTPNERDALKMAKHALRTAQTVILLAGQLADEDDPIQRKLNGPPAKTQTVAEILGEEKSKEWIYVDLEA